MKRSLMNLTGLLLLAGWALAVHAAEITAELDRDRIVEGETVTLVIQTDDPKQSLETNLDALDANFHIVDQRSETQMSIVNGRQSATVRLLLTLEPKRSGQLTIPSLQFRGGNRTAPKLLSVEKSPELAPGEQPAVFIEVEVDPLEGPYYVHAQLSLKVRIFYQQNLTEAAINPPAPDQASVRLLDEVPYQADRNGERYRVLERRYAIFPERSGELTIPPLQLTGRLIERPADRLWQPSVRGRRVRIESDPVALTIRPRPPEFQGDSWLPARSIELSQQITDGEEVRVGEPVTRTVILDAVGLEEHMLEEPPWPEISDARIYPDQPQGISRDDGQWVLGHREFRYAVVPETAGELVLPEIRLTWWDTVNDRQRVSILPEHRVTVMPSELLAAPVSGIPSVDGAPEFLSPGGSGSPASELWRILSLVFAILWLATLFLWWRKPGAGGAPQRPSGEVTPVDEQALLRAIRKGASSGDARTTHAALGRWLRHYGPAGAHGSLMGLAQMVSEPALAEQIRQLDAAAYAGNAPVKWSGSGFWSVFQAGQQSGFSNGPGATGDADVLDLYAQRETA